MSKTNPVKKYIREQSTKEEQSELLKEVSEGGPRASILLAATFLEDALRKCLEYKFGHLDEAEMKELFEEQGGPLYTFAGKIRMAYALGIIDADIRHDLDLLKNLRNGAAHGLRKVSFKTRVVTTEIEKLKVLANVEETDTRLKFRGAFRILLIILIGSVEENWPLGVNTLATMALEI